MNASLIEEFSSLRTQKRKGFAVLIDPDDINSERMLQLIDLAISCKLDYFLVGGSLVKDRYIHDLIPFIKSHCDIPIILFPASLHQVVPSADAILFLSLISGRNADLLIGKHVEAAPIIRESGLEVLPTGYLLIDCGRPTTASYMSNSFPIPYDKASIAACTAMAGEMLGLQLMYMDGGSGAERAISTNMVKAVREQTSVPLICGGGIRSVGEALRIWEAGADVIVIGNAIEKDPSSSLLQEVAAARYSFISC